ncbi:MAG: hypothetical protein M1834_001217 [Cirrosporium novae-zelandiae]|nr:MAG: hypothetical protein M1834_001217 [Cirrosporium novae-zelandiae]
MVQIDTVRASNAKIHSSPIGQEPTAVFVGATSGIGMTTVEQFAQYTNKPTAYLVGRNETSASKLQDRLRKLNPQGTYRFVKADVSLLQNVDRVCDEIKQQTKRLDLLVVSIGYLTFSGRTENANGLDNLLAVRYYMRMRFIVNLLPLLTLSSSPRVISVCAAGREQALIEPDLELREKYSLINAANQPTTMTSLFMEELSRRYPTISFIHTYPGVVKTNILQAGFSAPVAFVMRWIVIPLLTPITIPIKDAGERHLFVATSARYPPAKTTTSAGVPPPDDAEILVGSNGNKGSGAYLVDWDCEAAPTKEVLKKAMDEGKGQKIWEHTLEVFDRIKANGN